MVPILCYKIIEKLYIFYILGLAGIYLLMEDSEQAVTEYRKVLQLAAKFSSAEKEEKLIVGKIKFQV